METELDISLEYLFESSEAAVQSVTLAEMARATNERKVLRVAIERAIRAEAKSLAVEFVLRHRKEIVRLARARDLTELEFRQKLHIALSHHVPANNANGATDRPPVFRPPYRIFRKAR